MRLYDTIVMMKLSTYLLDWKRLNGLRKIEMMMMNASHFQQFGCTTRILVQIMLYTHFFGVLFCFALLCFWLCHSWESNPNMYTLYILYCQFSFTIIAHYRWHPYMPYTPICVRINECMYVSFNENKAIKMILNN